MAPEFLRRLQIGLRQHVELTQAAFDATGRGFPHVLCTQRASTSATSAGGRQLGRLDVDAHRRLAFTEDAQIRRAPGSTSRRLDDAVHRVRELQPNCASPKSAQTTSPGMNRPRLGDHRLIGSLRQARANAGDLVAHFGGGDVRILGDLEADGDVAAPERVRGDQVDAFDAGQRILQRLGDLVTRSPPARRPLVAGADADDGPSIFGYSAHRRPLIADEAEQHHHQRAPWRAPGV